MADLQGSTALSLFLKRLRRIGFGALLGAALMNSGCAQPRFASWNSQANETARELEKTAQHLETISRQMEKIARLQQSQLQQEEQLADNSDNQELDTKQNAEVEDSTVQLTAHLSLPEGEALPPVPPAELEQSVDEKKVDEEKQKEYDNGKQPPVESLPLPLPDDVTATPVGFTLEALEQMAISTNPGIQQAQAAIDKACGYQNQVGLKPNPTVGYTGEDIGEEGGAGRHGVFISQTIVRGDKLNLNRHVLNQERERLQWELDVQRTRILTDVRRQYYQILGVQQRTTLTEALLKEVQKAHESTKILFKIGEVAEADVLQMDILVNEIEILKQNAQIELKNARRKMAALINQPHLEIEWVVGTLDRVETVQDFDGYYHGLLTSNPAIQVAQYRIHRAQALIQREQQQPTPNLLLQGGLAHDFVGDTEVVNFQAGMPLPLRNRNQGNISAAMAEYRRAQSELDQLQLSMRSKLADVWQQYEQAETKSRLLSQKIVPQAQKNLEKVRTAYDNGELDLIRLFVAQRSSIENQLQLVNAHVEREQARALLDGKLLSGGLTRTIDTEIDSSLRGNALSGQ